MSGEKLAGIHGVDFVLALKAILHRRRGCLAFVAILVVIGIVPAPICAQDYLKQTGAPTFTTSQPVELGFVNVPNGNLHLEIPLGFFPQRGGRPFVAKLVYDSRIWRVVTGTSSTWQPTNVPNSWAGWRFVTSADVGSVSYTSWSTTCLQGTLRVPGTVNYQDFTWTSPDGTRHVFPITTRVQLSSCGATSKLTGAAMSADSSGFYMSVTNAASATVYAPDGSQVLPTPQDTNGNYFSKDSSGNVIDTLGRTPVKVTTSCNANSSQTCYDILNSQGGTSRVTVTTTSISVNTSFAQSGVTEYSGTLTAIQSIALPDGTSYTFSYDSGTTAGHYGALTGITLPTGGQINYGYTTYQDSFGNRNRWVSSRTSGGGTWSYTASVITTCASGTVNCQQKVTVTKPSGDNVVYTFTLNNGAWRSQVQSYSGAVAGANLLATTATTWDTTNPCVLANCTGASYIRKTTQTTTLPVPGGTSITSETQLTYDTPQNGNVTAIKEWKFLAGASPTFPAAPDRETDIAYLATTAYTSKNIINRPSGVTVKDGAGNQLALTNFSYDTGTLTPITGATQHDDTNFGTTNTTRGNPTHVQRWVGGTSYLTTTLVYDTTGQVVSSQDTVGNTTNFSYADNFFTDNGASPPQAYAPATPTNAYLTSVSLPLIGAATFGYYFNTGKRTFSKDQNGADSFSHFLDSLDRLTHAYGPINPSGNRPWVLTTYAASETQVDAYVGIGDTSPSTACASCRHDQTLLDNLGRVITQTLVSDPEGATIVNTAYDSTGRVLNASHPYRTTTDPTYGLETPSYDGLNRVVKITHPDNSAAQTYYGAAVAGTGLGGVSSQLCSSTIYGLGYPVLALDEAGKKRQAWTDGFGRTIEVDEPDSSGSLTSATCYLYDLVGNFTQVVQGSQTRTYTYDGLSRITASSIPESGTTNFYYTTSTGGLCAGSSSAVCRRTDARGITTTYSYDALNRLTGISYSDTTPAVSYFYDQTLYNGLTITNGKGRRTGMSDASGATAWSYDAPGHILTEQRTIAGITKAISYSYNLNGSVASITYPGGRQVDYTVSNAQRLTSAKDHVAGTQYTITASYAPPGGLQSLITGKITGGFAGISESHSFNNRLEYTSTQATSSAGTALNLSLGYNLPGGNNGSVASITNNVDTGRTENLTYDPLNRIASALSQATSGANCWGQNFAPDALANLNSISVAQCSAWTLSVTVDGNNHITSPGFGYDAAGNMTADGSGLTYTFDAENRITTAAGVTYTYDGNGLRVKKSNGTLYWRSITGEAIAESDLSGNITSEYVFFAGRRIARRDSAGNVFYYFADHLGTTRTITDANGTVCYDAEFTPYGQEMLKTNTCPQNYKFTGYERDPETGLDYAFARYYSARLGHFLSADPVGGSIPNPQSLNRYAYVVNNATNFTDPRGLKVLISGFAAGGLARFAFGLLGFGSAVFGSCQVDGLYSPCGYAQSLLRIGAAVQCPNNVCLGVNRDNLPVQFVATMVASYYVCLQSGTWSSREAAGTAAINCANGASIATNTEYGGSIYQTSSGRYSFTLPVPGTSDSVNIDYTAIPVGTTIAGDYHTHGAYDPQYYNEQFSPTDIHGNSSAGLPGFLGTPQDRIEIFYPGQAATYPYGCVLVGSAVPVGPGISTVPVPVCP